MGMFADLAIVDYHLSFYDQGKQTSVFCFCLQQTNGSLLFPFSICRKQTKVAVFHGHGDKETLRWIHGNMETWRHRDMETSNGKWKMGAQPIFLNPFTLWSLCKGKFVFCLFVDEEKNRSYTFASRINRLKELSGLIGLAHLWRLHSFWLIRERRE